MDGSATRTDKLKKIWVDQLELPEDRFDPVLVHYNEPARRYHNADHLDVVVSAVIALAEVEEVEDLEAVVAAAFYHDAIYVIDRDDNELLSAEFARADLVEMGWTEERSQAVATMIEGTATHNAPQDLDTAVLFDADLYSLALSEEQYQQNVLDIRAEYSAFSDDQWRRGRAAVLQAFLARESIYATDAGRDRWEEAARANLTAELSLLVQE